VHEVTATKTGLTIVRALHGAMDIPAHLGIAEARG